MIGPSASVLPMNIQLISFRIDGLISLQSKGLSRVFFNTSVQKHQLFDVQLSLWSNSHVHDYWKNYSFDQMYLCWQSYISAFQYAVQVYHYFSSKEQVSFNFMAAVTIAVILEPKKIKSLTVSTFPSSICYEVMGLDAMILVF